VREPLVSPGAARLTRRLSRGLATAARRGRRRARDACERQRVRDPLPAVRRGAARLRPWALGRGRRASMALGRHGRPRAHGVATWPTGSGGRRPGGVRGVLSGGALLAAARRRRARPLLRSLLVLPCPLVRNEPPRPPLVARVSGAALRLVFAVVALAEALRVERPGVALRGLAPVDRPCAAGIARRRTSVTPAALMLTLPWVSRAPRAPRQG
jgi:hypothetical protein